MIVVPHIAALCCISIRSYAADVLPASYAWSTFTGPVSGEVHEIDPFQPLHTQLQSDQPQEEQTTRNPEAPKDYVARPLYSFAYGVDDPNTGNVQSHSETRDGSVVKGEYSVMEPDGVLRNVLYTADAENGFRASVRFIPPSSGTESVSDAGEEEHNEHNQSPPSPPPSYSPPYAEQQQVDDDDTDLESFPERPSPFTSPLLFDRYKNYADISGNDADDAPQFDDIKFPPSSPFDDIKFPLPRLRPSPFKNAPSEDSDDYKYPNAFDSFDSAEYPDPPSSSFDDNSEPSSSSALIASEPSTSVSDSSRPPPGLTFGLSSGSPCVANRLPAVSSTLRPRPSSQPDTPVFQTGHPNDFGKQTFDIDDIQVIEDNGNDNDADTANTSDNSNVGATANAIEQAPDSPQRLTLIQRLLQLAPIYHKPGA
ncbi:uncharacterized protein LOC126834249 [Adelges cooleyi]|uniref:uncharacterized protein LOC126834249 n=1 Tax=Adelges cooleyi TaxID=133065 RepID=UPI0021807870|nr:uncharacterized protein LOC126834249 [Adelges cooleyi]